MTPEEEEQIRKELAEIEFNNKFMGELFPRETANIFIISTPKSERGFFAGPMIAEKYPMPEEKGFLIKHSSQASQEQIDEFDRNHVIPAHHQKCKCYLCRS